MNLEEAIRKEMEKNDETEEDIEAIKLYEKKGFTDSPGTGEVESLEDLDIDFSGGYGSESGPRFWVFTEERVYFKEIYDGSESVTSVPRNPVDEVPPYVGGG